MMITLEVSSLQLVEVPAFLIFLFNLLIISRSPNGSADFDVDGSNDAIWRKECAFGGRVTKELHLNVTFLLRKPQVFMKGILISSSNALPAS